jgi:hypothetical protein
MSDRYLTTKTGIELFCVWVLSNCTKKERGPDRGKIRSHDPPLPIMSNTPKTRNPAHGPGFLKKGGEDEHAFGLRSIFPEDLTNNIWHFYYNIGAMSLPNDNATETIRSVLNLPGVAVHSS